MMWMGLEVGLGVESVEETGQGCMYCRKWVRSSATGKKVVRWVNMRGVQAGRMLHVYTH